MAGLSQPSLFIKNMIYLSISFSVIVFFLFYFLLKKDIKESLIAFLANFLICSILGLLFYFIGTRQDYYSEVWNYKGLCVRYYESWNERVSCIHTIEDSKGNTIGHMHSYDVSWHSAYFTVVDEYGNERYIDESRYIEWKDFWRNITFVEMHRDYHNKDGNMYESNWPKTFDTIMPIEIVTSYQNKIRVSKSVFNYPKVSAEIQEKYYRPADKGNTNAIVSYDNVYYSSDENMLLRRTNAYLGSNKKIHIITILWDADIHKDISVLDDVFAAWKGPNKNELIVSIGLSKNRDVVWCNVNSWCDDTTIHSIIRQDIFSMKSFNAYALKDIYINDVSKYWTKKDFRDFSYINNPLPIWVYVVASIFMVTSSVMIFKFLGIEKDRKWKIAY